MRVKERIDNFLQKVDLDKLSKRWNLVEDKEETSLSELLTVTSTYYDINIVNYWKENYDQRFGQVLINLGILSDDLKIWCDEDDAILLDQGLPLEEVLYWGSNYDKDMNLLPETIYRLIKDLDSDHIEKIYTYLYCRGHRLSPLHRTAFLNVLKSRDVNSKILNDIEEKWNNLIEI